MIKKRLKVGGKDRETVWRQQQLREEMQQNPKNGTKQNPNKQNQLQISPRPIPPKIWPFSLASHILVLSLLRPWITRERDNLPLGLHPLEGKAGICLRRHFQVRPAFPSCPKPHPSWLQFCSGRCFCFPLFICLFWKVAGEMVGGDLGCFSEKKDRMLGRKEKISLQP